MEPSTGISVCILLVAACYTIAALASHQGSHLIRPLGGSWAVALVTGIQLDLVLGLHACAHPAKHHKNILTHESWTKWIVGGKAISGLS